VNRFADVVGVKRTFSGVVEDRGRDRAAEVGIEALVNAVAVRETEAGQAQMHAAEQVAALLDVVEGRRGHPGSGESEPKN
jgi:hypothetical protein